jgi:tRNA U55 pseudouridine synthase TruB
MISESQDKEVSKYVKLATPSVHGRATSVYRTLYESLGLRLGCNSLELGLARMSVSMKTKASWCSLLRKSGTA